MIVDVDVGGVLLPGLLVLAVVALLATIVVLRFLSIAGGRRVFVHRPLVEIAAFALIYGLLVQTLPFTGLFS
ncbi:conserved hypothetical protein [uncultured Alphaproteobacteria bacterium]|uniref:DUF1656 domain-containing protein n=1 Tax=uncultured Alphaproteobacteria bacterium TaxID=91750 RepID=A0A212JMY0_9PROT|nr:conserved hypothetical protein [uncultured Alphaproteobacteria bacterium]